MNWRWRLLQWWVRWNLQRDGASPETIRAALLYVGVAWEMQRLVQAGLDHTATQPENHYACPRCGLAGALPDHRCSAAQPGGQLHRRNGPIIDPLIGQPEEKK